MSENKGDLISRKDLRKQINNCKYFHSSFQKMTVAEFLTIVYDLVDNAPTVEAVEFEYHSKLIKQAYQKGKDIRPQGECRTCRHRDPEDKKCDCGGQERQGCLFPVSDDYYCKYYEKGGAEE